MLEPDIRYNQALRPGEGNRSEFGTENIARGAKFLDCESITKLDYNIMMRAMPKKTP